MNQEQALREIKDAGRYISDNAANILGDFERGITSLKLIVAIEPETASTVTVKREHIVANCMHD